MKFHFQFSNLLGTVYRRGNLLFTPDGNSILSPVGNKISLYNLKSHTSETLPIEARYDFTTLALSPNGVTLLGVTERGEVHLISLISRSVLHTLRTDRRIYAARFSPDAKLFAITKENGVFVYRAPGPHTREYNPFVMERVLQGAYDETTCIAWSSCSRLIAVGSKDMTTRIYALAKFTNFPSGIACLGGATEPIVACFFEAQSLLCYTASRNGHLVVWEPSVEADELNESIAAASEAGHAQDDASRKTKKKKKKREANEDSRKDEVCDSRASESEDDVEEENGVETMTSADATEPAAAVQEKQKLFFKRSARHFLKDQLPQEEKHGCELTAADFHASTHILVAGFSNGAFFIYEMPDASVIHSLSISEQGITSVSLNCSGDWIGLGCSELGQLLVWEWQSETYVLKQQGHFNNMSCVGYSPDGQFLATGGRDGKVKLWSSSNGFCFVTFSEHTSAITGIAFTSSGKVVISASLDGSVRAFDMKRYRNFKTLTSPRPVQFSCVAVDASGDLIAAGGSDVYEIYLWSMQTGRLLEVIGGHEGPVSAVAFSPSPTSSRLASVSWDKTLRLWDALSVGSNAEVVQLGSDATAVAFRPDGRQVAAATLNGHVSFFDASSGAQTATIEGRGDLGSGRADADLVTARQSAQAKSFTALCYTADGSCILAGGNSKNICIYHVGERLLLKKFELTQNRSFDAMDDVVSRKKLSEFGNLALVEDRDDETGSSGKIRLPGTKKGDMSSRGSAPEVSVSALQFSPTGRDFAAATTEGLLIYSLDTRLVFDPYELAEDITPAAVRRLAKQEDYGKALLMALKLNEESVLREITEKVPTTHIALLAADMPEKYVALFLKFLGAELESTRHLQFYSIWCHGLLSQHGLRLKRKADAQLVPTLNLLHKNLLRKHKELGDLCNHNLYTMRFLSCASAAAAARATAETAAEAETAGGGAASGVRSTATTAEARSDGDEEMHSDDHHDDENVFASKWNDSDRDSDD